METKPTKQTNEKQGPASEKMANVPKLARQCPKVCERVLGITHYQGKANTGVVSWYRGCCRKVMMQCR